MTGLVIEAALRSLLLALAVWAALRLLGVRNVLAEKAAWTMVLTAAIVMPLVLIFAPRWPGLHAPKLLLPDAIVHKLSEVDAPLSAITVAGAEPLLSRPAAISLDVTQPARSQTGSPVRLTHPIRAITLDASEVMRSPAPPTVPFSVAQWAMALYLLVAAALCVRLLFGLAMTLRLWHTAAPIQAPLPQFSRGLRLRASSHLNAPVTIGSGILLPANYAGWGEEKLRIVLAHEQSHVQQGDFYLQVLASLYAALLWLSPLGWWLKRKLSDLSEAIGDRSGLKEAASRTSYARILLEFAATPRPTMIGVAMACPSSLSRRMERLLNDSAFRQAFAGSRRTLLAALLAPLVLFSVTALVRVQAASTSLHPSGSAPAIAVQPTMPAQPATLIAHHADNANDDMIAMAGRGPAIVESDSSATEATFDRTLTFSGKVDLHIANASGNIHLTRGAANQVRVHARVRSDRADEAQRVQAIAANPPMVQDGNSIHIGVQHEEGENQDRENHISIDYEIEAPADAALEAGSGSGNITDEGVGQGAKLSTGSGNVMASGLEGGFKAETGSGNVTIENTGDGDAKAETGSGNIDIKGVRGALQAETGSGEIKATGTPSSAWKLETGSGNVEFSPGNAGMSLDASTGSGGITSDRPMTMETSSDGRHMRGQLNGGGPEVRVETGSGNIHIRD